MHKDPRIIFFDLETIPNLQEALENWTDLTSFKPGKRPGMSASVNSICSFGWRIFGGKKAVGVNAWDFKSWKKDVNDDKELCKEAAKILDSADAVVTFNGKNFDMKFIQARLKINGLNMVRKSIPHIDLCKIAGQNMFLLNNRLKTIAKYLLRDSKMEHDGWPLWVNTHGGVHRKRDRKAEDTMGRYNLKDVDLMVPLFKELRPLIVNIPNYNLWHMGSRNLCPSCGGTRVYSHSWRVNTKIGSYKRYLCRDCGSWSRSDDAGKNLRSI